MKGNNGILPEGEKLRRAVHWISETLQDNPEAKRMLVIQEAELKFDLTPKESMFLYRTMASRKDEE